MFRYAREPRPSRGKALRAPPKPIAATCTAAPRNHQQLARFRLPPEINGGPSTSGTFDSAATQARLTRLHRSSPPLMSVAAPWSGHLSELMVEPEPLLGLDPHNGPPPHELRPSRKGYPHAPRNAILKTPRFLSDRAPHLGQTAS